MPRDWSKPVFRQPKKRRLSWIVWVTLAAGAAYLLAAKALEV